MRRPGRGDVPNGVVFDMDGLLLDSERLARDLFFASCRDLELEVDAGLYHRCIGSSREATDELLSGALGPQRYAALVTLWSERYEGVVRRRPVPRKPGVEAVLARLAELGVPRALATSTGREIAEIKLRLAGLLDCFSVLVCGGETPRGKPYPDPYLAAVEGLGLTPGDCWACEDSDNGVRAAHSAGLRVFQVPDLVQPGPDVAELGHAVLPSLGDLLTVL